MMKILKTILTENWIYNNVYADGDAKKRDHCHINGKYGGCNIHIKLRIH